MLAPVTAAAAVGELSLVSEAVAADAARVLVARFVPPALAVAGSGFPPESTVTVNVAAVLVIIVWRVRGLVVELLPLLLSP